MKKTISLVAVALSLSACAVGGRLDVNTMMFEGRELAYRVTRMQDHSYQIGIRASGLVMFPSLEFENDLYQRGAKVIMRDLCGHKVPMVDLVIPPDGVRVSTIIQFSCDIPPAEKPHKKGKDWDI